MLRRLLFLVCLVLASPAFAMDELVIGMSTVKKHITHIFDKLSAKSRTQALVRARALHLL